MKSKILLLLLISFFSVIAISGQNSVSKTNPVGLWKFEAPNAPEGYSTGSVTIGFAEKKYSVDMMFSGNENKLSGEKVKVENDSISFSLFVNGQDVAINMKMENNLKMSGKGLYSDGEVQFTLTKVVEEVKAAPKK